MQITLVYDYQFAPNIVSLASKIPIPMQMDAEHIQDCVSEYVIQPYEMKIKALNNSKI